MLWTRLAPDPLNGGGLGAESYRVRFEVAADPRLPPHRAPRPPRAGPEEVHTVHAEVTGLRPARRTGTASSPSARSARSGGCAPRRRYGTVPDSLRFAYVSCQNYTHGYFPAFEDLAQQQDVELVVHLGDYIYEGAGPAGGSRTHAPAANLR